MSVAWNQKMYICQNSSWVPAPSRFPKLLRANLVGVSTTISLFANQMWPVMSNIAFWFVFLVIAGGISHISAVFRLALPTTKTILIKVPLLVNIIHIKCGLLIVKVNKHCNILKRTTGYLVWFFYQNVSKKFQIYDQHFSQLFHNLEIFYF